MEVISISHKVAGGLSKIESQNVSLAQLKQIAKYIIQTVISGDTAIEIGM